MWILRPATHYQVDLTTGTPDQVCLIVCVLIRYQVDLTGGPYQVYLYPISPKYGKEFTIPYFDLIRPNSKFCFSIGCYTCKILVHTLVI
jgi:hypothetical protein